MYSIALVFDLETIPDLSGYAIANDLVGRTEEEIRDAIGEKFPKHIYHQIICIGAVVAHFENDGWIIDSIGAPSVQDRPERELIEAFVTKVAQLRPQLITFNGHSFDLPALRYRAMVHKVSAPGLSARSYFKRYSMDALDLCDGLSSFGASGKVTLDELSKIIGLPGKPGTINGKEVDAYFRAGRIKEIADYCETDVVNTYLVWLRYELFCGRLSKSGYEASIASLNDYLQRTAAIKPHLAHFLARPANATLTDGAPCAAWDKDRRSKSRR
jgi:predicted PolB exonuclease-like 3'-5' exonuclease